MDQIIECVPNFSEGRNRTIINKITAEIESVEGVSLLDVDPGEDTNRTVVTFVGTPDAVVDAAFKAIAKASTLIDMSVHKGAHPRMGATDVCPLIPVTNITLDECVEYAKRLARRVGCELKIPVYLYGHAATRPERKNLPDIRKGEYEALPEKMKSPGFMPDEGPAVFNPKTGATVIGVREFMLAYNVNLNTRDVSLAKEIAGNVRESGVVLRNEEGAVIKDKNGDPVRMPGKLKQCQAGGWFIEKYGCVQVTMNLFNYKITGLHTAYDAVCEEADRYGLWVTGSELVGVTPKQALFDAGVHYLNKMGRNIGIPEDEVIQTAIKHLGLNDISGFDPEEKIIEYAMRKNKKRLIDLSVGDFIDEVSSDSPAPGGGSVSAVSGALSAALASMVANLTFNNKEYAQHQKAMKDVSVKAQELKEFYLESIDKDTDAFNGFMAALRMPKATDAEKQKRKEAIQEAAKQATKVPLTVLESTLLLLDVAEVVVNKGNINALSDAVVSASQALAAAEGAWMNVMINIPSITDKEFAEDARVQADILLEKVIKRKNIINKHVKKRLES